LSEKSLPSCVQFFEIEQKTIDDVDDFDLLFPVTKKGMKYITFLDGYTCQGKYDELTEEACLRWYRSDREAHRLIILSSMAARPKAKFHLDLKRNIEEFYSESWMLEEYQNAIEDDNLFSAVLENLDAIESVPDIKPTRQELVEAKHYFAGGSARYMFVYRTKAIIDELTNALNYVTDFLTYIENRTGIAGPDSVTRFLGYYPRTTSSGHKTVCLISQFLGSLFASAAGPDRVKRFCRIFSQNPSMNGWFFEMWFFLALNQDGISFTPRGLDVVEKWDRGDIIQCDLSAEQDTVKSGWVRPLKWNQGGYDAIFIDVSIGLVRFVQITRGDTHSLKLQYFYNILHKWQKMTKTFEIQKVDIFFLVPSEKLAAFKLSSTGTTGHGLLHEFGWSKGKEAQQIKVCGVDWK
jgi:hypothetical protein